MKGICEFCTKEYPEDKLESTTFVGYYCIECHQTLIEQSREAIREIRERNK